MSTTTTNFGWTVPSDTDLVKDGAAAIRTALGGVDTSFVDLKGGTTGQVLSKASGTDLDFTWVAQDDSNAIQNAIVDAKGDLIVGASADTPARLAVGTNGHILTADSTATNGVKWAAPAGGGKVLQVVSTSNSSVITTTSSYPSFANSGITLSITPSATTSRIMLIATIPFLQQNKTDLGGGSRIVRGGGAVIVYPQTAVYNQYSDGLGNSFATTHAHAFVDSPATTSAITYEIQFCQSSGGSSNANISFSGQTASFIAMEIGA